MKKQNALFKREKMISKSWYLIFFVSFPQDTCKMKYIIQAWVVSQSVQATITEISQMGCLLNKFPSHSSEAWKSRIIALADLYLMRPTSWFRDSHLLIVSSRDRRGVRTLWCLFHKGTNPDHEVSVLMTSSLSTSPSFKYQHFGILILKEKHICLQQVVMGTLCFIVVSWVPTTTTISKSTLCAPPDTQHCTLWVQQQV